MAQLQDLISDIENVHAAISGYANSLGTYINDPTQPFPQFDQTKLTIDNLLTLAETTKDSAVDMTSGALSAVAYKVAGLSRELSTRTMTKAMLYDLAVNEATQITQEVRGEGGKKVSQVKSMTPEQAEGQ